MPFAEEFQIPTDQELSELGGEALLAVGVALQQRLALEGASSMDRARLASAALTAFRNADGTVVGPLARGRRMELLAEMGRYDELLAVVAGDAREPFVRRYYQIARTTHPLQDQVSMLAAAVKAELPSSEIKLAVCIAQLHATGLDLGPAMELLPAEALSELRDEGWGDWQAVTNLLIERGMARTSYARLMDDELLSGSQPAPEELAAAIRDHIGSLLEASAAVPSVALQQMLLADLVRVARSPAVARLEVALPDGGWTELRRMAAHEWGAHSLDGLRQRLEVPASSSEEIEDPASTYAWATMVLESGCQLLDEGAGDLTGKVLLVGSLLAQHCREVAPDRAAELEAWVWEQEDRALAEHVPGMAADRAERLVALAASSYRRDPERAAQMVSAAVAWAKECLVEGDVGPARLVAKWCQDYSEHWGSASLQREAQELFASLSPLEGGRDLALEMVVRTTRDEVGGVQEALGADAAVGWSVEALVQAMEEGDPERALSIGNGARLGIDIPTRWDDEASFVERERVLRPLKIATLRAACEVLRSGDQPVPVLREMLESVPISHLDSDAAFLEGAADVERFMDAVTSGALRPSARSWALIELAGSCTSHLIGRSQDHGADQRVRDVASALLDRLDREVLMAIPDALLPNGTFNREAHGHRWKHGPVEDSIAPDLVRDIGTHLLRSGLWVTDLQLAALRDAVGGDSVRAAQRLEPLVVAMTEALRVLDGVEHDDVTDACRAYAETFLGHANELLGDRGAADAAFRRAVRVCPEELADDPHGPVRGWAAVASSRGRALTAAFASPAEIARAASQDERSTGSPFRSSARRAQRRASAAAQPGDPGSATPRGPDEGRPGPQGRIRRRPEPPKGFPLG